MLSSRRAGADRMGHFFSMELVHNARLASAGFWMGCPFLFLPLLCMRAGKFSCANDLISGKAVHLGHIAVTREVAHRCCPGKFLVGVASRQELEELLNHCILLPSGRHAPQQVLHSFSVLLIEGYPGLQGAGATGIDRMHRIQQERCEKCLQIRAKAYDRYQAVHYIAYGFESSQEHCSAHP